MSETHEYIELLGVRTHNLRNIDVAIPLGQLTVVTGVSGSGKSSLVFDTLYGESYRRYVESLSSYARQYLKQLPRPTLRNALNLPAAIAVKQAKLGHNQRSTVGTMTELNDIIRLLFGTYSSVVCCGQQVRKWSNVSICEYILNEMPGQKVLFLAPLKAWGNLKATELKKQLEIQGFTRCFFEGQVKRIEDTKGADLLRGSIVVDRIQADEAHKARCLEAAELSLKLGRGEIQIAGDDLQTKSFHREFKCRDCGKEYQEPTPTFFNYNHPSGACPSCQGFARIAVKNRKKIIPDEQSSLVQAGVAPWNFGEHDAIYGLAIKSAKIRGIDPKKVFADYSEADWNWLYGGDKGHKFIGINGYFDWLNSKKYKAHYRIHSARFHSYEPCLSCHGSRLNEKAKAYHLLNRSFSEVTELNLDRLQAWMGKLASSLSIERKEDKQLAQEAIEEAVQRLEYLLKMGLNYLTLARGAKTLSGGEIQRINMARSLGGALTGTLFCLDEPSVGLHARDSLNLLEVVRQLREQGNTIVVVEHERTLIEGSQHVIEVGPGAGEFGGTVVFQGPPDQRFNQPLEWPRRKKPIGQEQYLKLCHVHTHNLKGVDVQFRLGALNVVCGVSGSGKTSLIRHTLWPLLQRHFKLEAADEEYSALLGTATLGTESILQQLTGAYFVSQEGIGRSSRSTLATYLGLYDFIRKLFADTDEAKARKLKAGFFSFNVPGGRCEFCKGLGYTLEDLSFLGEMPVSCNACAGRRFTDEALNIHYRGRNLLEILQLTITQARDLFFDQQKLRKSLDQIIGLGLGYLTLGQNTSSFSGGEAQRLKLLRLLLDAEAKTASVLIFDEPSTGLSDKDVSQLLQQMLNLCENGHTVIVVEHHLGLISAADWLIEVGPEASDLGGQIVYQGLVSGLQNASASKTAPFLQARGQREQA